MASVVDMKSSPSKADNARERELYRYFHPPEPISTLIAHEASSPDTTLTALAQLCALRLHAKRAMISVIDAANQYFVAESTKTLDLVNNNKSEVEGDGLWFGCGTVDKSGRLCEKTIEMPPILGRYPCFTVTDLSKDERFNLLPFVAGPPYFKFYAGTPLTTKKGINIGSLFIIDDQVRESLNADQEQFLGTIAQTVMKYMETTSEAEERKKVMRLSLGMNAFVEGKSRLDPNELGQDITTLLGKSPSNFERSPRKKKSESRSLRGSGSKDPVLLTRQRHTESSESHSEPDTSQDDSDSSKATKNIDTGHGTTFARAANILCECLNLKGHGGVVFLDTTSRLRTDNTDTHERKSQKAAEVVSYSTSEVDLGLADQSIANQLKSFTPVEENLLHSLLARYPRGKMWTFDQDGNLSSSEEDALSPRGPTPSESGRQSRVNRKQIEAMLLQRHFPGVRQLLFTGLWDAGSSRWFTGGFIWTTSHRQVLTRETELSYFRAFGNSVMAEVSRLASVAADRQKADFIGSISHEFRSPLHGILASAEFLAETDADAFQSSLVDTILSCGRTLLDTINHILDYSKINSFERNWRNVRKPGSKSRGPGDRRLTDKDAPPMMNIYATIDVAAVAEEVVEGVYAGQIYQDISSTEATDFSSAAKAEAVDCGIGDNTRRKVGQAKEVNVIIDIAHENYVFTTQPGALKRVIMNIFGNALKYTQKGSITVKLSLDPCDPSKEESVDERMLEIKVTDTGKGISSEYLRTSLFNPFCQEDALASGTGLGLSIVRSIVTMLRGTIVVQSEVRKGTEVIIRLPLSRLPGTSTPVSTPSSNTTDSSADDSINTLHTDFQDNIVALLGFDDTGSGPVLKDCIESWFGLNTTKPSSDYRSVDLIVIDEKELSHLQHHGHTSPPTVVLCSNASRTHTASRHHNPIITEFVSKPVGPHKLAKAMRICLERAKSFKSGLAPAIAFSDEDSPMESEADTIMPELENLTLETQPRMDPIQVQTNGVITASDSENALMAIDNSSSNDTSGAVTLTEEEAFPFPAQENTEEEKRATENRLEAERASSKADLIRRDSRRPALVSRMTEPIIKSSISSTILSQYDERITFTVNPPNEFEIAQREVPQANGNTTSLTASNMALHNGEASTPKSTSQPTEREKRPPRLLLVDDNKINLRLLETYMRKRKYELVDSAENGQLAVQAAEVQEHGYDIIFMDISMPVMNGFEATRAIRDIEDARNHNSKKDGASAPALIIALTGLASSRDQTEAFTSGVDLFMTKPVSFKEVGRLLDNWEAHGGIRPPQGTNPGS